jgi:protein tyrosine phosphatase (PTP) superfamily phosphohydrolase (DUF442 family)
VDFSKITDQLYIGTTPMPEDYHILRELGVQLVINMRFERPPYPDPHHIPIPVLWLPSVDAPFFPIPVRFLRRGVKAALQVMERGGVVYAHCAHGKHRAIALGTAILIANGHSVEEASQLIKARRAQADPDIWYIRRQIERFSRSWKRN